MSNWLKAESSSGSVCGSDQVAKCDLFPYHFRSHFLTCYRKSDLIEVPLLGPIHHQKNDLGKWSLNGLSDEKNMGFWIWTMAQTGTNDLLGWILDLNNGLMFVVHGWWSTKLTSKQEWILLKGLTYCGGYLWAKLNDTWSFCFFLYSAEIIVQMNRK